LICYGVLHKCGLRILGFSLCHLVSELYLQILVVMHF